MTQAQSARAARAPRAHLTRTTLLSSSRLMSSWRTPGMSLRQQGCVSVRDGGLVARTSTQRREGAHMSSTNSFCA